MNRQRNCCSEERSDEGLI